MSYQFLFLCQTAVLITFIFLFYKVKRNVRIIRVPKILTIDKIPLGDFFGHLYGLISLIGLTITVIGLYNTYKKIENGEIQYIISTLSYTFILLLVSFLVVSAFYVAKISKFKKYESEVQLANNDLKRQYIVNKYQSELFHSITHYQRNINARLFEFSNDKDAYNENDIKDLENRFSDFLVILTSNLQSYFSFITQDNCAVTLKQIDNDKKHVKTLFRDPINFNKRKKSDRGLRNNGLYQIEENTAFRIITDPKLKNNFFYDDNLIELAESGTYENSNPDWSKLYNATIVVPISMLLKSDTRDVIGFITVDNKNGGLANDSNKEFLCGIADLLYNLFLRYSIFTSFVESKK